MSRARNARPAKAVRVVRNAIEDGIQGEIFDMLKVRAIPYLIVFSIPNGGYRSWAAARTMKETGQLAGVLDILAIHPATRIPHFMEVKTPTGRLTDEQKEFSAKLETLGIPYAVVRSLEEAARQFDEWQMLT